MTGNALAAFKNSPRLTLHFFAKLGIVLQPLCRQIVEVQPIPGIRLPNAYETYFIFLSVLICIGVSAETAWYNVVKRKQALSLSSDIIS